MMTTFQYEKRLQAAQTRGFTITEDEGGFVVSTVGSPGKWHLVSNESGQLSCTCEDFQSHLNQLDWVCEHILAARLYQEKNPGSDSGRCKGCEALRVVPESDPTDFGLPEEEQ